MVDVHLILWTPNRRTIFQNRTDKGVSNPPTTQSPPTTTTLRRATTSAENSPDAYSISIFNGTAGEGPTNSVFVTNKSSVKYLSNLNEVDKTKQKLTDNSPKGSDWSKGKNSKGPSANAASYSPVTGWLLRLLSLLATFSCG
ncbi:uncharacterized protein LOC127011836 isoform X6 [Drosophila biarmipes]|uniref:uncharacterized protein LOC127011836 isoform X1 n=1 Tax=Drosophila biarmipes TaxID=125945 RepID=UPI0021CCBCD2|nr:uncharacterized protein LOC127011836 isoform X1 [Drosophila biarmipes]XP_050745982.1 uncharacterized protein LOC127011836 isoform X2 [Drosophila biarmipes]XP_050745983.1 uncharacterized protein LOC127011836 isoform X3 [Drosophila biarmipes]XP_050745984.1 uncharacterized protein LOC127011836 isoform X4 [Drosophila biarmipes]XP_050745985.1 uncharacterized protein LOC127011836 isoform X5 [Drosophila biarmipes]XP_050745986.1 uncharacterized protein LOC127011836 isoform X6 [Drosophila biarmipes]